MCSNLDYVMVHKNNLSRVDLTSNIEIGNAKQPLKGVVSMRDTKVCVTITTMKWTVCIRK